MTAMCFSLEALEKRKTPETSIFGVAVDAMDTGCNGIFPNLMKISEACAEEDIPAYINPISMNMIHAKFPQADGFVQIDIILSKYPEFTKFYMFSPMPSESRYKGAHRNMLLKSILYACTKKEVESEGKWRQMDIDNDGLFLSTKTLVDKDGRLLTYKNTGEALYEELAKDIDKQYLTHDPNQVISNTVGYKFKLEDVDTFEKLLDIIKSSEEFRYKGYRREILEVAKRRFRQAADKLDFPNELI